MAAGFSHHHHHHPRFSRCFCCCCCSVIFSVNNNNKSKMASEIRMRKTKKKLEKESIDKKKWGKNVFRLFLFDNNNQIRTVKYHLQPKTITTTKKGFSSFNLE